MAGAQGAGQMGGQFGGFGRRMGGFPQQAQQLLRQGWEPGGRGQGLLSPNGMFGVRPSWMQSPTIPMGSWTPGSGGVTNTIPMGGGQLPPGSMPPALGLNQAQLSQLWTGDAARANRQLTATGVDNYGGVPPSPQSLGFTMSGDMLLPPQAQGAQQYGAYPSNPGVMQYVGGPLGR